MVSFAKKVKIYVDRDGHMPFKAHRNDAGYDLFLPDHLKDHITPNGLGIMNIDTCISILFPKGYYGRVIGRSSSFLKGITVHEGTIDNGYTGHIHILCTMNDYLKDTLSPLDRIAQIVFCEYPNVLIEETKNPFIRLRDTRGAKGFRSSGS